MLFPVEHVRCLADQFRCLPKTAHDSEAVTSLDEIVVVCVRQAHGLASGIECFANRAIFQQPAAEFCIVEEVLVIGETIA